MHIIISAIGKLKKNSPEYTLMTTYLKRLKWTVDIKEYEEKKVLNGDPLKRAEGELLLSGIPKDTKIIALDEHGSTLSSREFAGQLHKWRNTGSDTIAFLIGGADGLGKNVLDQANLKLSFGRMTLPHFLMRVVLAEQIYRAQTILDGHPYHRDG